MTNIEYASEWLKLREECWTLQDQIDAIQDQITDLKPGQEEKLIELATAQSAIYDVLEPLNQEKSDLYSRMLGRPTLRESLKASLTF